MDSSPDRHVHLANHGGRRLDEVLDALAGQDIETSVTENAIDTLGRLRGLRPAAVVLCPMTEPVSDFELAPLVEVLDPDTNLLLVLDDYPGDECADPSWGRVDDLLVKASPAAFLIRMELALRRFERSRADRRRIEALVEQSTTDYKTGLYNDRYILRRLVEEFQRAERHDIPLSVIMADIDEFKGLNDRYGHPFADFVLQTLARHVGSQIRKIDIPGRYGGDELLILLPNTGLDEAAVIADRIRTFLDEHVFEKDGQTATVTLSQGINTYSGDGKSTPDEFLKQADQAVLEAKARGKNRVCLFPLIGNRA